VLLPIDSVIPSCSTSVAESCSHYEEVNIASTHHRHLPQQVRQGPSLLHLVL